jgi:hypothetical protein
MGATQVTERVRIADTRASFLLAQLYPKLYPAIFRRFGLMRKWLI